MADQLTIRDKIESRGHWRFVVRPVSFDPERISSVRELQSIISRLSVHFRGWDFPHIEPDFKPLIGNDWIGQDSSWQHAKESWRFFQSAMFADYLGFEEDWRGDSTLWPANKDWRPGAEVHLGDTVATLAEMMEFSARLATAVGTDQPWYVAVGAHKLKGRRLAGSPRRWLSGHNVATLDEFTQRREISAADLIANARDYSVALAVELFERFDVHLEGWTVREIQDEVLYRRRLEPPRS